MCIGIPMQVIHARPGRALCEGRGEVTEVETLLVGERAAGDWLLVFLASAREVLTPARAAEIDSALDLLAAATGAPGASAAEPDFALPSRLGAGQLAALVGAPVAQPSPAPERTLP